MRKRVTTVALVVATALLAVPPAAHADLVVVTPDGRGATIRIATGGGADAGPGTPGGRTCSYVKDANLNVGLAGDQLKAGLVQLAAHGTFYDYRCSDATAGIVYVPDRQAPAAPTYAAQLARQAYKYLPVPAPQIQVNPPAGRDQLVNLPTWLWVTPTTWGTRWASASVPGLAATATAVPVSLAWTLGNGDRLLCHGPGVAYDPNRAPQAQHTNCSYTYRGSSAGQPGERYVVTATITWQVTWTSTIGVGGTLPPLARSSQTSLRVAEAEAIN
jgi:hypothetical protein